MWDFLKCTIYYKIKKIIAKIITIINQKNQCINRQNSINPLLNEKLKICKMRHIYKIMKDILIFLYAGAARLFENIIVDHLCEINQGIDRVHR